MRVRARRAIDHSVRTVKQFGKPMYSTRIILEDLNPVWEETCVMLVTMDEIKADEGG